MKAMTDDIETPVFETPAFTTPPPLAEATVALVTTASLHHSDQDDFAPIDTGYRVLDGHRREDVTGHWSPNFDAIGFGYDMNTVFPLDRLDELAERGLIGRVPMCTWPTPATSSTSPRSEWTPVPPTVAG